MPTFGGIGFGGGGVGKANFTNTATGTYSSGGKNYKFVTFTGSGSLTIDKAGFVDVLVVGSGGPGGAEQPEVNGGAGGGGAGGVVYKENYYLDIGNHTVVVGAGGVFNSSQYGNQSVLDQIKVGGGGQGGCNGNPGPRNGFVGWNGGGGSSLNSDSVSGGASIWGIGFAGGNGGSNQGGGGGGAGGAGSGTTPGVGVINSITGSPVTYGVGGNQSNAGGGAGTANTGNGGAGSTGTVGNSGGSGVVIVRVQI